ncbi:hypothetical protein TPHA_0E00140 [Tetrapisispora phaffii CBS 4417]|uniref:DUF1748-domain-containing protein n=1 Tax=Tetrapisispora phaffii (strain ATCC 24235 / CBS 4417 / NBRC 1672 / NRRL Y-8282 / UCD 70-5) TaxID=1071381 RepID=G8BT83_TETPH|nr:hypothetical protein TPHA_0E00140 [Tetrapisispora phaffii CBS 4417]CCE63111.1 hypothetical protein TPHA_0E00140 [Tetrapisispora phaffii CBS 4417]
MTFIGKAIHVSIDLTLLSVCLAGIKRNTGLQFRVDKVEDTNVQRYINKYLNFGESIYDYSVATCGSSSYFSRK